MSMCLLHVTLLELAEILFSFSEIGFCQTQTEQALHTRRKNDGEV